jgi:DNA-binding transcriptional LysR family regulator
MELRQLETFVRLVELGTFTRAAEEMSLTQPAVTRQIAALEAELKTRLLDRLGRRVELTAAGKALFPYADRMVRLSQEAVVAVRDVAAGVSGPLSVGASGTASAYILPDVVRQFTQSYPTVELSVHTGPSARVADMVMRNLVDVGVVMNFEGHEGIDSVTVAFYESVLVVPLGHKLIREDKGAPVEEFAQSDFIVMQRGTNLRSYVDQILAQSGEQPRIVMELDNVEAIKKMIEAGLGVSLLPKLAVEEEVASGRLAALPLAGIQNTKRPISAIYRQDKYLSAALKEFVEMLRNELKDRLEDGLKDE